MAMTQRFSGLGLHLGNLSRLSDAKSRSISAENPTGEKGKGGMAVDGTGSVHARGLGRGWKISPSKRVAPGETLLLGDIEVEIEAKLKRNDRRAGGAR